MGALPYCNCKNRNEESELLALPGIEQNEYQKALQNAINSNKNSMIFDTKIENQINYNNYNSNHNYRNNNLFLNMENEDIPDCIPQIDYANNNYITTKENDINLDINIKDLINNNNLFDSNRRTAIVKQNKPMNKALTRPNKGKKFQKDKNKSEVYGGLDQNNININFDNNLFIENEIEANSMMNDNNQIIMKLYDDNIILDNSNKRQFINDFNMGGPNTIGANKRIKSSKELNIKNYKRKQNPNSNIYTNINKDIGTQKINYKIDLNKNQNLADSINSSTIYNNCSFSVNDELKETVKDNFNINLNNRKKESDNINININLLNDNAILHQITNSDLITSNCKDCQMINPKYTITTSNNESPVFRKGNINYGGNLLKNYNNFINYADILDPPQKDNNILQLNISNSIDCTDDLNKLKDLFPNNTKDDNKKSSSSECEQNRDSIVDGKDDEERFEKDKKILLNKLKSINKKSSNNKVSLTNSQRTNELLGSLKNDMSASGSMSCSGSSDESEENNRYLNKIKNINEENLNEDQIEDEPECNNINNNCLDVKEEKNNYLCEPLFRINISPLSNKKISKSNSINLICNFTNASNSNLKMKNNCYKSLSNSFNKLNTSNINDYMLKIIVNNNKNKVLIKKQKSIFKADKIIKKEGNEINKQINTLISENNKTDTNKFKFFAKDEELLNFMTNDNINNKILHNKTSDLSINNSKTNLTINTINSSKIEEVYKKYKQRLKDTVSFSSLSSTKKNKASLNLINDKEKIKLNLNNNLDRPIVQINNYSSNNEKIIFDPEKINSNATNLIDNSHISSNMTNNLILNENTINNSSENIKLNSNKNINKNEMDISSIYFNYNNQNNSNINSNYIFNNPSQINKDCSVYSMQTFELEINSNNSKHLNSRTSIETSKNNNIDSGKRTIQNNSVSKKDNSKNVSISPTHKKIEKAISKLITKSRKTKPRNKKNEIINPIISKNTTSKMSVKPLNSLYISNTNTNSNQSPLINNTALSNNIPQTTYINSNNNQIETSSCIKKKINNTTCSNNNYHNNISNSNNLKKHTSYKSPITICAKLKPKINYCKDQFLKEFIFFSELEKYIENEYDIKTNSGIIYSKKFCALRKNQFEYYNSKEQFILLQKPCCVIPISIMNSVKTIILNNKNRKVKKKHFKICFSYYYEDDDSYEFSNNYLDSKNNNNCKEGNKDNQITEECSNNEIIFATNKEEVCNTWVKYLNFLIKECRQNSKEGNGNNDNFSC